jgi:hypothetical protein
MQVRCLEEIRDRFDLPLLQFTIAREEITGLENLRAAAAHLGAEYINA